MKIFSDKRPIMGQDPFVFQYEGMTFLIQSMDEKRITISRFDNYTGKGFVVWDEPHERQVWAPEMHQIDGRWYIYYSFSDGQNHSHRNYFLESDSPFGPFNRGRVGYEDIWGIDLTMAEFNENRYAIWSGWEKNGDEFPQHLYIAKFQQENDGRWSTSRLGERVRIASPQYSWEKSHAPINEGPQAYVADGVFSLLFSANASWTMDYCTGIMKLVGDDPLNPEHWWKAPEPLMYNAGHGHVLEGNFIYHRKMNPFPGWTDREIRVVPLERIGVEYGI